MKDTSYTSCFLNVKPPPEITTEDLFMKYKKHPINLYRFDYNEIMDWSKNK